MTTNAAQTSVQSTRSLPADPTTLVQADAILRAQCGISLRRVRANLRTGVERASQEQIRSGRAWYPLAQQLARHLDWTFNLPAGMGACLIAALSPRTRWSDNVAHAHHMASQVEAWRNGEGLLHAPAGCMGANYLRAIRVIEAGDARWQNGDGAFSAMVAALGQGPKVRAFAHNVHGLMASHVTVDVWAMRAALAPNWKRGDDMAEAEASLGRKGVYGALSLAYMAEARLMGVSAAEFQAIVWCAISDFTG